MEGNVLKFIACSKSPPTILLLPARLLLKSACKHLLSPQAECGYSGPESALSSACLLTSSLLRAVHCALLSTGAWSGLPGRHTHLFQEVMHLGVIQPRSTH